MTSKKKEEKKLKVFYTPSRSWHDTLIPTLSRSVVTPTLGDGHSQPILEMSKRSTTSEKEFEPGYFT